MARWRRRQVPSLRSLCRRFVPPLRGLVTSHLAPTAYAVGCILMPLRGCVSLELHFAALGSWHLAIGSGVQLSRPWIARLFLLLSALADRKHRRETGALRAMRGRLKRLFV